MMFSILFVGIYCVAAEKYPQVKLWQGVAYGLLVWVMWHLIILPAFGATGAPWDLQMEQHLSEVPGHMVWMWAAEVTRRDLRNRISHQPDAEVPSSASGTDLVDGPTWWRRLRIPASWRIRAERLAGGLR
jgi:putative membrane protein